jgi:hypothetical protein
MILPMEAVVGTVASVFAIGTALFGGGMFRQALKHNGELAVQKYKQDQTDVKVEKNDVAIQKLNQEVALINKDVKSFENTIRKLDVLPEISSKLSGIEVAINFMKETIARLDAQATHANRNQ